MIYLESGSKNRAMMIVASTMHMRYMVLISNISESGGLSRLSMAWFPITQKFEPHSRNSSSDSIVLLSPKPPPCPPLDNTARKQKGMSWQHILYILLYASETPGHPFLKLYYNPHLIFVNLTQYCKMQHRIIKYKSTNYTVIFDAIEIFFNGMLVRENVCKTTSIHNFCFFINILIPTKYYTEYGSKTANYKIIKTINYGKYTISRTRKVHYNFEYKILEVTSICVQKLFQYWSFIICQNIFTWILFIPS